MVDNFNGCRVHYLEVYTLKTLHLPSNYGGLNFSVCWDCKVLFTFLLLLEKIIPWCRYLKSPQIKCYIHLLEMLQVRL